MSLSIHSEILSSLASVREDVRGRVEELDRYRAVRAIEQTIAEFPGLDDLARSLADVRDRVQQQLSETREYLALCAVEKMMPELTGVLAMLSENSGAASRPADFTDEQAASPVASVPGEREEVAAIVEAGAVEVSEIGDAETVAAVAAGQPHEGASDEDRSISAVMMPDDLEGRPLHAEPGNSNQEPMPTHAVPAPAGEGAPASTLAYSLAQLMVQALVPPPLPPDGSEPEKREPHQAAPPQDHPAAQSAGRAA